MTIRSVVNGLITGIVNDDIENIPLIYSIACPRFSALKNIQENIITMSVANVSININIPLLLFM
jgi:hypothetical protein